MKPVGNWSTSVFTCLGCCRCWLVQFIYENGVAKWNTVNTQRSEDLQV